MFLGFITVHQPKTLVGTFLISQCSVRRNSKMGLQEYGAPKATNHIPEGPGSALIISGYANPASSGSYSKTQNKTRTRTASTQLAITLCQELFNGFMYSNSFNLTITLCNWFTNIMPIYSWGNWGTERKSTLTKIMQLLNGKTYTRFLALSLPMYPWTAAKQTLKLIESSNKDFMWDII